MAVNRVKLFDRYQTTPALQREHKTFGAYIEAAEGLVTHADNVHACTERFAKERAVRMSFGVRNDDPKSPEWAAGLKRYIAASDSRDAKNRAYQQQFSK